MVAISSEVLYVSGANVVAQSTPSPPTAADALTMLRREFASSSSRAVASDCSWLLRAESSPASVKSITTRISCASLHWPDETQSCALTLAVASSRPRISFCGGERFMATMARCRLVDAAQSRSA